MIIAEILRGGEVESVHAGAFVVADAHGGVVRAGGEVRRAIFPRSAIKGLQALPLVASGAADSLGLSDRELALACASHAGLPEHAATSLSMLEKAAVGVRCLECGAHWPVSPAAARGLAAAGLAPSALHNNCSGKHAGFVCTAIAAGRDPAGYVAPEHPVMRDVTSAVAAVTGARLSAQSPGVDGCSIPAFQIGLVELASGFARFGTGRGMPEGFAAAAARLRKAVAAHPEMVAGPGIFDTVVMQAFGARVFVKLGAEGVYCGALPELGLGFAVKCDDGSARAAEIATAGLLRGLLGAHPVLDQLAGPVFTNWNGRVVGTGRCTIA